MAQLNGQNVCDEVAFRIANRLAANGTGAGSIINYTNDILGLIGSAASWVWDQTSIINTDQAGLLSLTNCDHGKKISIFDTASKQPIVRVDQDDYSASGAGYVGTDNTYNTFRLQVNTFITNDALIQLFPTTATGNVDIYYHFTQPVLTYGSSPTVRWTVSAMDALLKDWVTAKVKMVLGLSGGEAEWGDCMGRIKEFRRMYTTERENTGPEDEAASERQSKNSVGRD